MYTKLDYEREGREWKKIIRSSPGDWSKNVETIVQWSPFSSEADLLCQVTVYTSCVGMERLSIISIFIFVHCFPVRFSFFFFLVKLKYFFRHKQENLM